MKADDIGFLEFIGPGKKLFYIPVYQRNYDWKRKECKKLFEDIIEIAQDDTRKFHFLGSIVYLEEESAPNTKEFSIIDGQQRLTSIMILLKALMDSSDNQDLKEEIQEDYLINKRSPYDERIRLKPMKTDAKTIEDLINNDFDAITDTQIFENYNLFKDLIDESDLTPDEIYEGLRKLEIVYIKVDNENPQLVFESLNSTGLSLTQADLIRNFLLMSESHDKQERLYREYWTKIEKKLPNSIISEFVRDYLTMKTGNIPKKSEVYNDFKEYSFRNQNFDSEGLLEELNTLSKYYHWFKYFDSPDPKINDRLKQIQSLKSTVVYPYLLNIFEDHYTYESSSLDDLSNTLDIIISYLVRRSLCEYPTNALNKVFASLSKDVEAYSELSTDQALIKAFSKKTGRLAFPTDEELKDKIKSLNAYGLKIIKFILYEIEKLQGKEIVDDKNLTIEHIMPQVLTPEWNINLGKKSSDIHEKYLNNLGNLTLTAYNPEISNKAFTEKKKMYQDSNVFLTKSIVKYSNWGEDEIIDRCNELTDTIIDLWRYPSTLEQSKIAIESRTEFDFNDEVNVTGRKPVRIDINGEKQSVSTWKDFLVSICQILYEYDKDLFLSLLKYEDFNTINRKILDTKPDHLRNPGKIADNVYIETHSNANTILNISKLILSKFEDFEENSSYTLKPS